jgi:hypothetical protein
MTPLARVAKTVVGGDLARGGVGRSGPGVPVVRDRGGRVRAAVVVTPPALRRPVFRVPTSDYGGMRDGTEHRGEDG